MSQRGESLGRIEIDARFGGPPGSGNGGYVAGRLAAYLEGTAEAVTVRIRVPPPLGVEMRVERDGDGVALLDGEHRVCDARAARLTLELPPAPAREDAEAATRAFRGFHSHRYPTCFVCGPERGEGDGLRIFAGPLPGSDRVAAIWEPDPSLRTEAGTVAPEFVWAALDCPGLFAFPESELNGSLLAEFTAALESPVPVGEPVLLVSWEIERRRRLHRTGTALFSLSGMCHATAVGLWYEVPLAGELVLGRTLGT